MLFLREQKIYAISVFFRLQYVEYNGIKRTRYKRKGIKRIRYKAGDSCVCTEQKNFNQYSYKDDTKFCVPVVRGGICFCTVFSYDPQERRGGAFCSRKKKSWNI